MTTTVKVLFDATATPQISVDIHPVKVPLNAIETIHWKMNPLSTPGAVLALKDGIKFKVPPPPGRDLWTQAPPTRDVHGNWHVVDDNNGSALGQRYSYEVNVTFENTTVTLDPDIDNDPPPVPHEDHDHEHEHEHGDGGGGGQHHPDAQKNTERGD
jgi:hypothetical protein